ncbi:MAG: flagellar hook-basal body complex protein FliE [Hyphomicrobiaceae bacterium]|nr:flagellar hook-basal body complex protein FliE [Hyphomicrobiaceae bacterium]
MAITATGAANAYASMQRLAGPVGGMAPKPAAGLAEQTVPVSGPGSFGDMVEKAVTGTLDTGRAAEQRALSMAEGKASIVDVVTAVAETELAVETLVTVRDKVISAYKDILNMPI